MTAVDLAAAFPIAGTRHTLAAPTRDEDWLESPIIRHATGEAVGSLALHVAGDTISVGHLWVAPPFRGYGAGSEAAWLFRQLAASTGARQVEAWAHPALGLSVYFWIRMGFQPQHGPGPHEGITYRWQVA